MWCVEIRENLPSSRQSSFDDSAVKDPLNNAASSPQGFSMDGTETSDNVFEDPTEPIARDYGHRSRGSTDRIVRPEDPQQSQEID